MKQFFLRSVGIAIISASVALSFPAQAEKRKISGTARGVSTPSQSTPYAGENPKREIAQRVSVFHWISNNADWDGIVETSPQQTLTVDGVGKDVGHIVFHYKNGDESWGWFSGTSKIITKADGAWEVPFEGEKMLTGGTGKFANAKGTIKYKGKVTPTEILFTWEGEVDY